MTNLEERAEIYYRATLASTERIEKGRGLREPSVKLLQAAGNIPGQGDIIPVLVVSSYGIWLILHIIIANVVFTS